MFRDRKQILFIDDDPTGREIAAFNLISAGYHVDLAKDGESGLEMFTNGVYDLVMTDVQMPGISGLSVVSSVRRNSADIPIIVMTAFANIDLAVTAMRAGANNFVNKPFTKNQLLSTVTQTLQ